MPTDIYKFYDRTSHDCRMTKVNLRDTSFSFQIFKVVLIIVESSAHVSLPKSKDQPITTVTVVAEDGCSPH